MHLLRAPLAVGCAAAIATPIALVTTPSFGQCLASKLLAPDGAADDSFGLPVAVGGGRVIVGSPRDDDNGPFSGAAYIFHPDGSSWLPEAKLIAPDGTAGDLFGLKVAISGKVAVCAPTATMRWVLTPARCTSSGDTGRIGCRRPILWPPTGPVGTDSASRWLSTKG